MTNACPETIVHAWAHLMRVGQVVFAAIEQDLKAAGFPSLSWYDVLLELSVAEERRLRAFEIERRTLLTQYNLSRLLDRLEREGLVERKICPEDGRSRWVVLTPAGQALRKKMWPVYAAAINRHLGSRLDQKSALQLVGLLKGLTGEVNEDGLGQGA